MARDAPSLGSLWRLSEHAPPMLPEPTVFVIDADVATHELVRRLAESVALRVETYASAQEFLDGYDPQRPGCVVLDVHIPGTSDLEVLDGLLTEGVGLPVIVVSRHGDVPMVVRAMKAGVLDFIEKPFRPQVLLDRIHEAIAQDAQARHRQADRTSFAEQAAALTSREKEVMDLLLAGKSIKEVAVQLNVGHKTVQVHRARMLKKMHVGSVTELVRRAATVGYH